ncbi:hypothetical protein [Salinisphaera sp. T31B1]|uniref:Lipoprotein n=1 Tax=Salinisphaera aquimarina TaxID=2094031 RepID=A0ABV7EU37_9GAMM
MSHFRSSTLRTALPMALMLCITMVAGCGSDVGPSADTVRLDVLDRLNQRFHGLLDIDQFTVDHRNQLSENRIQFHATASYKLNVEQIQHAQQANRVLPGYNAALDRARRSAGTTEPMILLYRRAGDELWQLSRIQPGHQ